MPQQPAPAYAAPQQPQPQPGFAPAATPGAPAPGGYAQAPQQPKSSLKLLPVTPYEIVTYAGALFTFIGCLLPAFSLDSLISASISLAPQSFVDAFPKSVSMAGLGIGVIVLLLAIATAVVAALKKQLIALILAALNVLVGIITFTTAPNTMLGKAEQAYPGIKDSMSYAGLDATDIFHVDYGANVLVLGLIALIVGTAVSFLLELRAKRSGVPVKGFGGTGAEALEVMPAGPSAPAAPAAGAFHAPVAPATPAAPFASAAPSAPSPIVPATPAAPTASSPAAPAQPAPTMPVAPVTPVQPAASVAPATQTADEFSEETVLSTHANQTPSPTQPVAPAAPSAPAPANNGADDFSDSTVLSSHAPSQRR